MSNCTRSSLDVLYHQGKRRRKEFDHYLGVPLLRLSLFLPPHAPWSAVEAFFKQSKINFAYNKASVKNSLEEPRQSSWAGGDCALLKLMVSFCGLTGGDADRVNSGCPMLWWGGAGGLSLGEVWGDAVVNVVPAARRAVLVWDAKPASLENYLNSLSLLDLLLLIPLRDTMGKDVGQACIELWGKHSFRNTFTSLQVASNLSDFLQGEETKRTVALVSKVLCNCWIHSTFANSGLRWLYRRWCLLTSVGEESLSARQWLSVG